MEMESPINWAKRLADGIKKSVAEGDSGGVYLAVIEVESERFDVEIEIDHEIVAAFMYAGKTVQAAYQAADAIGRVLETNGVKVFKTRSEWEKTIDPD